MISVITIFPLIKCCGTLSSVAERWIYSYCISGNFHLLSKAFFSNLLYMIKIVLWATATYNRRYYFLILGNVVLDVWIILGKVLMIWCFMLPIEYNISPLWPLILKSFYFIQFQTNKIITATRILLFFYFQEIGLLVFCEEIFLHISTYGVFW